VPQCLDFTLFSGSEFADDKSLGRPQGPVLHETASGSLWIGTV
jgi:hypothetical protein